MAETDSDDVEISNNTAVQGAGIYLHNIAFDGTAPSATGTAGFLMKGGSIKNNIASSTNPLTLNIWGGGVYLTSTSPSGNTQKTGFYMGGGSIEGNKALGSLAAGGGVLLDGLSIFTFAGGEITGNEAGQCGGGVSVGSYAAVATVLGIKFLIDGGALADNKAGGYGGAIFMQSDKANAVDFKNGSFSNNKYTDTTITNGAHTLCVSTGNMYIGAGNSFILAAASLSGYQVINGDSDNYVYTTP
jgi:hypothetical protein